MTDITELALITKIKKQLENFDTVVLKEGEALALVEALEKAQATATQQGNIACALLDEVTPLRRHADEKAPELRAQLIEADRELKALRQRIAELEPIRAAAEKLVRCKGRYHSEQNYRALAALFGVTAPDLPPLDGESRTVTVKLPDCDLAAVQHMSGGSKDYCNGFVDGTQNAIRAMRAAGVEVREAE